MFLDIIHTFLGDRDNSRMPKRHDYCNLTPKMGQRRELGMILWIFGLIGMFILYSLAGNFLVASRSNRWEEKPLAGPGTDTL